MVEYSAENAQGGAASAGCGAYSRFKFACFPVPAEVDAVSPRVFGSGAPSGNASVMPPYSS